MARTLPRLLGSLTNRTPVGEIGDVTDQRAYHRAMGVRTWLIDKLGGDEPVGDPERVVEVAVVDLWQSQLLVTALRERGIAAESVQEHSVMQPRERLLPQARILVQAGQRAEAIDIIDAVTTGQYGPTDDTNDGA